jgi:hypothetical protein
MTNQIRQQPKEIVPRTPRLAASPHFGQTSNAENPRTSLTPISVQTLIEHYRKKELGAKLQQNSEDAGHLRGLSQQMDSAWLKKLSRYRCEGSCLGAMAPLAAIRKRKQSQNSEHHECGLQSRCSLGTARCESHTHGASKRQADRDSYRLSIEQIAALLRILKEPTPTMSFVAVFTGLQVAELLGVA